MRRWLGIMAILVVGAIVALVVTRYLQAPYRQRIQFDKIQRGMTEEEVIALMGPPDLTAIAISKPGDNDPPAESLYWWRAGTEFLSEEQRFEYQYGVEIDGTSRRVYGKLAGPD